LPHLDGEEMMTISLGFSAIGITLGEECIGHLCEIVERARWQEIEPV